MTELSEERAIEMDKHNAAMIVDKAFPKSRLFGSVDYGLTITDLHSALFRARKYAQSNTLGDCITWARRVIREHDGK